MPPARRTRPNAPGDPLPALAIGPTRRRTQGPPGLRSLVVPRAPGQTPCSCSRPSLVHRSLSGAGSIGATSSRAAPRSPSPGTWEHRAGERPRAASPSVRSQVGIHDDSPIRFLDRPSSLPISCSEGAPASGRASATKPRRGALTRWTYDVPGESHLSAASTSG